MSRYLDNAVIGERGGDLCGEDAFVVVACSACGRQYLYNEEILDMYPDPADLRKRYKHGESFPCVGCDRTSWEEVALDTDSEAVTNGPWVWARGAKH